MRVAPKSSILLLLMLAGCATTAPREYLDEETAATITTVAKPWVFMADSRQNSFNQREYLSLYAVDVNRMGDHRQYIAMMQLFFDTVASRNDTSGPALELATPDRTITLKPATQTARQLGVATPLEKDIALGSRWWYFPASKEEIAYIARSKNLHAALLIGGIPIAYVEFRNGSAELTAFSAALQ